MKQIALVGLLGILAFGAANPDAGEIVKRSVANTMADWKTAPQFGFMERDVVTKKAKTVKTYRVVMIDGSPYNEPVGENGEPTGQENDKLQQETRRRQQETSAQRQKRIGEYDRERRQDNALLREMISGFDFRVTGETTINGRRCFMLEGNPKPGYQPKSRETRVLTGMRGKMWIDEQDYQWVRVEAEVFRPVAFGLFTAHVEPGTRFVLEQKPVSGGLWLPSHFSVQVKAKILRYWSHNSNDDETYWDYRRAAVPQGDSPSPQARSK